MKYFEYGDEEISNKELSISVVSMVIGAGILTMPRGVAENTKGVDGWLAILAGGLIAMFFAWICAKLASRFPKHTFYDYTASVVTQPVARGITFLFGIYAMMFTAYEMRVVANILKIYLFDRTPIEVLGLIFLWVVIYAASGSRAAILRINLMFMPIVLFMGLAVVFMNLGFFETDHLRPFFTTDWKGYFKAIQVTGFTFSGFEILLFYVALSNKPSKAPKAAIIGLSIPLVLYLIIYTFVIGVFGHEATKQMIDPTIELAKEVEVPGQFFERFESIFFTIWIMTFFTTATMALDITLICLQSVLNKVNKMTLIFLLAPIAYLVGMIPEDLNAVSKFGDYLSYFGVGFSAILPSVLLIIAKIRGIKGHA